jgi:hypothetical protein
LAIHAIHAIYAVHAVHAFHSFAHLAFEGSLRQLVGRELLLHFPATLIHVRRFLLTHILFLSIINLFQIIFINKTLISTVTSGVLGFWGDRKSVV